MRAYGRLMASAKIGPTSELITNMTTAIVPIYRGDRIGLANKVQMYHVHYAWSINNAIGSQKGLILGGGVGVAVFGLLGFVFCKSRSSKKVGVVPGN